MIAARIGVLHAVLCLVLTGWCLVQGRGLVRGPAATRWLWTALACLAVGEAFLYEPAYRWAEVTGGTGWGQVIHLMGGLLGAVAVAQLLHHLHNHPRRIRVATLALGVGAVATCVLVWVVDPPHGESPALDGYPVWYDSGVRSLVLWGVLLTYLGAVLTVHAVSCRRHVQDVTDPCLRIGMRLLATGTGVFGMGYVLAHAVVVALWHVVPATAAGLGGWDWLLDALTLGPALLLITAGLAWASITERLQVLATRRRVAVLKPFWAEVIGQVPAASPFADTIRCPATTVEQLRFQQTRLVVEVYDVLRRVSPDVATVARIRGQVDAVGLSGHAADAATRQIILLLGLDARWRGQNHPGPVQEPDLPDGDAAATAGHLARHARLIRRPRIAAVIQAVIRKERYVDSERSRQSRPAGPYAHL